MFGRWNESKSYDDRGNLQNFCHVSIVSIVISSQFVEELKNVFDYIRLNLVLSSQYKIIWFRQRTDSFNTQNIIYLAMQNDSFNFNETAKRQSTNILFDVCTTIGNRWSLEKCRSNAAQKLSTSFYYNSWSNEIFKNYPRFFSLYFNFLKFFSKLKREKFLNSRENFLWEKWLKQ